MAFLLLPDSFKTDYGLPNVKPTTPAAVSNSNLPEGMISFYLLNEYAGEARSLPPTSPAQITGEWLAGAGVLSTNAVAGDYVVLPNDYWNNNLDGAPAACFFARIRVDNIDSTTDFNTILAANITTTNAVLCRINSSGTIQVGGRSRVVDGFQSGTSTNTVTAGQVYDLVICLDYQNDRVILYVDGEEWVNNAVSFGSVDYEAGTSTNDTGVGGQNSSDRRSDFMIFHFGFYRRLLTQVEAIQLHNDPYQLVRPAIPMPFNVPAAVNVTGTINETLDNVVSVATGQVGADITGTIAETLDNVTSTATGQLTVTGSIDETLGNIVSTATGIIAVIGTITETLDNVVSAATGQVSLNVTGTINKPLDNVASTATGVVGDVVTGTINQTLGNVSSTATGVVDLVGTLAEVLDNITSTATGQITVTGSVNETLADVTSTATGFVTVDVTGTISETLDNIVSNSIGLVGSGAVTGTLSETLENVTSISTGLVGIPVSGSSAIFLGNVTSTASGLVGNAIGTGDITLQDITSVATGIITISGTVAVTLGDVTSIALAEAPANTIQDIRLKSTLMAVLASQSTGQ